MMTLTRMHRAVVLALVAGSMVAVTAQVACGTDPVGVEACQRIEKVRCESAQACGIDLTKPVHEGSDKPATNVAACVRYYDDQCLHGVVTTDPPSPQAVDACVNAIITSDCAVVKKPEVHPACAFLVPPSKTVADAAAEADTPADAGDQ